MKRKIWERIFCLSMSAAMLLGISVANKNEVTAAGTYDCTLTITTPVPGETPKQPVISDSSMKYEILGYMWEDECYGCDSYSTYISDTEFMNWYSDVVLLSGGSLGNNALKTFEDGHRYRVSAVAKVSDFSAPMGTEGEVTCIDAVSSEEIGSGSCYLMPVSALVTEMPEGVSLPSCLTENDTLVTLGDVPSMVCAPEGHEHTSGEYGFDDEYHWNVCSECGIVLPYTKSSHYFTNSKTEIWTVVKNPTATETGLWEKLCRNGCGYSIDSVVIPCKNDQTIVTTYDELRDALAKGGKQWITVSSPSVTKWISQEDMILGNNLVVDDPDADITIDMNGCGINRETGKSDDALFEIKAGKLRILSKSLTTPTNDWNLSFRSASSDYTLFKVHENGSLRVTNITGVLPNDEYFIARPNIISEGNLQIDGGLYDCIVDEFDSTDIHPVASILIKGGNAVINGGEFYSEGTAVGVLGGNLTINGGYFGGWDNGVYIEGDSTTVNIYGGKFDKTDTTNDWYQDYGVYVNGGILNVFDGDIYGDKNAVRGTYYAKAINIYGGYFRLRETVIYDDTLAAFCFTPAKSVTIYQGIFSGVRGIIAYNELLSSLSSFTLESYLVNGGRGVTVTDDGVDVDISTKAKGFGASYLKISTDYPIITKQPESVDAFTGDEVVFKVEAKNATRYVWYIFDADDESEQPYSWEDLKQYYDISGENTDTLVIKNVKSWFDNKGVCCTVYNDNGWSYSKNAYLTVNIKGDVNSDGLFNAADVVMLQKWLLGVGDITNWKYGDLCEDNVLNVYDLCLMKRMLL